jgi:dihydrofolate reductase
MRLVVSEFVTLDGVMQDPGGGETETFDRGGWAFQFDRGPEGDKFKIDELMAAEALLLGRTTYEGFAKAWPSYPDDEAGFSQKMNGLPKYVVSKTLERADWNNSTVLRGDVIEEVSKLKAKDGGDLLVAGSAQLVRALTDHGLVDELRLMVFPVLLGAGKRLFDGAEATTAFELVETKPSADVALLTLRPKG